MIRETGEFREKGDTQSVHYQPDQWLARRTVTSEKRAQYARTLATVGPAELQVYATQAKATDLAAAVLSRASQFQRKWLPFNVNEFLAALVYPDDYAVARRQLEQGIRDAATVLLQLARFQSSGNPSLLPNEKIARGLAAHRSSRGADVRSIYGYQGGT